MTKKDYQRIADAFRFVSDYPTIGIVSDKIDKATNNEIRKDTLKDLAERLALELKDDNANFQKDKFMNACGLD